MQHYNVEILHHAQIGQNAYTEYAHTIHIDKFSFYPQVWVAHARHNNSSRDERA